MTAQTSKTDKIQQKRQRKCDSIKRNEEYRNRKMNEFFIKYYMKSLINVIFTPGSNIPNFDNILCI